ncbi:hypothetical protein [Arthrobacter sp. efr-133-TYG-104]|uniref:hypothetical protein n=1 Tax=Arthrobacter sp. efr-133-TYG-104 TaxID=3040324 RepID=UPI00254E7065|nr:hypothetical protein [Arthrobacter sp. efr-133-TYG-104]
MPGRVAAAALGWMTGIGFEVVRRTDGDGEQVVRAEVGMGQTVLMDPGYPGSTVWGWASVAPLLRVWV